MMNHYAFLDDNNIVIKIFVGQEQGTDGIDWEKHYEDFDGHKCRVYPEYTVSEGYIYNDEQGKFYPPQPYSSWILDTEELIWKAPIENPSTPELFYRWNEEITNWEALPPNGGSN
jgi:hypothetical protein